MPLAVSVTGLSSSGVDMRLWHSSTLAVSLAARFLLGVAWADSSSPSYQLVDLG
jgi:hypothetical protein